MMYYMDVLRGYCTLALLVTQKDILYSYETAFASKITR